MLVLAIGAWQWNSYQRIRQSVPISFAQYAQIRSILITKGFEQQSWRSFREGKHVEYFHYTEWRWEERIDYPSETPTPTGIVEVSIFSNSHDHGPYGAFYYFEKMPNGWMKVRVVGAMA